jgi:hypothetical protein
VSFQAASALVCVSLVALAAGIGVVYGFWPEIRRKLGR